jgi:imidazoleglycerol-phosphate dehydratase
MNRIATKKRVTRETSVEVSLTVDGSGKSTVSSGLPFLDHMLSALCLYARFDLTLSATGDLQVDDHHTVEDCALVLGATLSESLGDRQGIQRFATAFAPLDEALARVVIDISNRPSAVVDMGLRREFLGTVSTENIPHFFRSFAMAGGLTLHLDVLRGENDHHRAEAAFKACGLALRAAVARDGSNEIPSTKGVL